MIWWLLNFLLLFLFTSVMSGALLLIGLSQFLFLLVLISLLWPQSSIIRFRDQKSIIANLVLAGFLAGLSLQFGGHLFLRQFLLMIKTEVFAQNSLNVLLSCFLFLFLLRAIVTLLPKLFSRKSLPIALVFGTSVAFAADWTEEMKHLQLIAGTSVTSANSRFYQVESFPFACRPLGMHLPRLHVGVVDAGSTTTMQLTMLELVPLPFVCKKLLLAAMESMAMKGVVVSGINLAAFEQGLEPLRIVLSFTKSDPLQKEYIDFLSGPVHAEEEFEKLAGLFLLCALITYLMIFDLNHLIFRKKDLP